MTADLLPPIYVADRPDVSPEATAEARRILGDVALRLPLGRTCELTMVLGATGAVPVETLSPAGRHAHLRLADTAEHWWALGASKLSPDELLALYERPWDDYAAELERRAEEHGERGVGLPKAGSPAWHVSGTSRVAWGVRADGTTVEVVMRPSPQGSIADTGLTVPVMVRLRVPMLGGQHDLQVLQAVVDPRPELPPEPQCCSSAFTLLLTLAGPREGNLALAHADRAPTIDCDYRVAHMRHLQALRLSAWEAYAVAVARMAPVTNGYLSLLIHRWREAEAGWNAMAQRFIGDELEGEAEAEAPVPWTLPPPRDGRWAEDVEREAIEEAAERTHRGVLDEPVDDADTADTAEDVTPFGDPVPADLWEGTR